MIGRYRPLWGLLACLLFLSVNSDAQSAEEKSAVNAFALAQAIMCERVQNLKPVNPGIAFSISSGKVSCFTAFDPVNQRTYIYHNWYHRDDLSYKKKLYLRAPRWSTVSSIQLREADKGPWRVEITGRDGRVLSVLRFSIID